MTLQQLDKYIESRNYKEKNMLHFYRHVYYKSFLGSTGDMAIEAKIDNFIKKERENDIRWKVKRAWRDRK